MNPSPVFVVALNADGKPTCQMAELIAVKRTWWHVRHDDGSVTRHNGGMIAIGPRAYTGRIPNAIGSRYERSMVAAYERAITDIVHNAWGMGYRHETGGGMEEMAALARNIIADIAEQMHGMGKLEHLLDTACTEDHG